MPWAWKLLACKVVALLILAGPAVGQDTDYFAYRVEDRHAVLRISLQTGERDTIAISDHYIPTHTLRVSSTGELVGFLEKVGKDFFASTRLVITDPAGERIRVINQNVQRFEFCCGHDKVAIIEGQTAEGGYGFIPEELVVVDVAGNRTPIGVPNPYELSWSAFDSSLYIKSISREGAQVYRFHAPSGEVTLTSRHGIEFSSDGGYYIDAEVTAGTRLFQTEDDVDVTASLPAQLAGNIPSWVHGSNHILSYTVPLVTESASGEIKLRRADETSRLSMRVYLVDAATGRIIESIDGHSSTGWVSASPGVLIDLQGSVRLYRLESDQD